MKKKTKNSKSKKQAKTIEELGYKIIAKPSKPSFSKKMIEKLMKYNNEDKKSGC